MENKDLELIEDNLVRAWCERNGWEYGDNKDYDMAVKDVKWFIPKVRDAGYLSLEEVNNLIDTGIKRYEAKIEESEARGELIRRLTNRCEELKVEINMVKNNGWEWKYFLTRNVNYRCFDRVKYINERLGRGLPLVITWVPNIIRLHCRDYRDVYGIPDIIAIEEVPTLFTNIKSMEKFRVFLIPYLITGYDIPEELERDEEPLVPFTAKTIEILKEIIHE